MLKNIIVGIHIFCVQFASSYPLLLCPLESQGLSNLFPVMSKMLLMSHMPRPTWFHLQLQFPASWQSSTLSGLSFLSVCGFLGHNRSLLCLTQVCPGNAGYFNTTEAKLQPVGMEVHRQISQTLCPPAGWFWDTSHTVSQRVPSRPESQLPTGNLLINILHISFSSSCHFPYFLFALPEITSQINHLYPNPFLRVWFWELEVKKKKKPECFLSTCLLTAMFILSDRTPPIWMAYLKTNTEEWTLSPW